MKYWLISDESVQKIRKALNELAITDPPIPHHLADEALHELDSGLHDLELVLKEGLP